MRETERGKNRGKTWNVFYYYRNAQDEGRETQNETEVQTGNLQMKDCEDTFVGGPSQKILDIVPKDDNSPGPGTAIDMTEEKEDGLTSGKSKGLSGVRNKENGPSSGKVEESDGNK